MNFKYEESALITKSELNKTLLQLTKYTDYLNYVATFNSYDFNESSINLPFDNDMVSYLSFLKKNFVSSKLKYFIDVGIGGSNLGTKAVYDALLGYYEAIESDRYPKMYFGDTNNSVYMYKLRKLLAKVKDPEEVLINVVTKSGKTTETIANMEVLLNRMPQFRKRLVITTEFNSDLWNVGQDQKLPCLPIPKMIGGRYSVFTAVGLFPLYAIGINIFDMLVGAMEMRNICLTKDLSKNPAAISAALLYLNYQNGKNINDTFVFEPELESLGKWYRQLMSESLGKDKKGITPTVSVGSADLHSMGQLYLGGPRDKFFTFVHSKNSRYQTKVPKSVPGPLVLEEVLGKSQDEIINAILQGVKIAYHKNQIPFTEILLENVSEKSIGKYFQFKMIEIMYLAKLLGVNAFNQPNVESFKKETIEILKS